MLSLLQTLGPALFAFLIGLVPALVWLTFWLFEDSQRPEPKWMLFLAFVSGMLAVMVVLPFQQLAASYVSMGFLLLLLWAALEEIAKTAIVWLFVLRRKDVDEPIDIPIYLITTALGFAALENAFFLFAPLMDGQLFQSIVTSNMRFIGASLVHVLSSAIIGAALAFAYYRDRTEKIWYGSIGVILAVLLHAIFNFLIISTGSDGVLTVFLGVWVGVIFLLLGFERLKKIKRPSWWEKIFTKGVQ